MTIPENHLPVTGPVVLNPKGLPAYCGTIWIDFFKGNLAISTREKYANAVISIYRHASTMRPPVDVDLALTEPDLVVVDTLLSSFLLSRQNVENDRSWPLVSDFVFGFLREIAGSEAISLQRKLQFMARRYGQLRPRRRIKQPHIRCVPYEVLEDLFSLVHPESSKNPFRTDQNRWRNYIIFMLLLQLGLRKSELLILNVGSFRSQYDVEVGENRFWLDIAVTHSAIDTRAKTARLKNNLATRQVPLTDSLVGCFESYLTSFRGDPPHEFMLTSTEGRPLSASSLDYVFDTLNGALTAQSRDILASRRIGKITPHSLRHTAAVLRLQRFVDSGMELEEAVHRLRPFFGWSRSSEMPYHYARAFFDPLHAAVWEETFNDSLATLRSIKS